MHEQPHLIVDRSDVELRSPVMLAAFRGWNDAGEAATFAASYLGRMWAAEKIASIDPEDFYDFQAVRPQVHLSDGYTRQITWPSNEFWAARLEGGARDALILVGTEPNTHWRTFSSIVVQVARDLGVELVVTLGALLADVPHSRPVPITGTAADRGLIEDLGLQRSRYEGPTGIVGVLHDACARAGIGSASLWAAVPHYLAITPNPKAALALAQKAIAITGNFAAVDELERATNTYEERVSDIVASDEDVQAYIRVLEERVDETSKDSLDANEIPSGESLAAELEHFLRERGEDSG